MSLALLQDALLAYQQGRLNEAVARFGEILETSPRVFEAHFFLSKIYYDHGELKTSLDHVDHALDIRPNVFEAMNLKALILLKLGRRDEALRLADILCQLFTEMQIDEGNAHLGLQLAKLCFDLGSIDQALGIYRKSRPGEEIEHLGVYLVSSLEEYCHQHEMTYFEREDLPVCHSESMDPTGNHSLFAAKIEGAGVHGGSQLPITQQRHVFVDQMIHNPLRTCLDRQAQDRDHIVLGNESMLSFACSKESRYTGPHVLIGKNLNFGHWMHNNLSRLSVLEGRVEGLDKMKVVISEEITGSRLECLKRMGYDEEQMVSLACDEIAWFDELWVPSYPLFGTREERWVWTPEAVRYLRDKLGVCTEKVEKGKGRRIFVSRRNARWRHLVNEEDLLSKLEPYGFEAVDPQDYSLEEQFSMAAETEILVGTFGAGLNLHVFMPEGTHAIQIILDGIPMDTLPTIGLACDQDFQSVYGVPVGSEPMLLNRDLAVSPDDVIPLVEKMLA